MKKSLLLLIISLYATTGAMAQDTLSPGQPKVIIYSAEEGVKDKPFNPLYLVKLNLLSAMSGDMGLSLEKKLKDKITVEGGLGVTVRNFSQGLIVNFFEVTDGINSSSIEREYKLGPSFIASLKYYPNGAIDEFFFGPEIRYRRYNSSSRVKGERAVYEEYSGLADFKLNFGYINFIEDNIFIEYNGAIGIRNRNQRMLTSESSGTTTPYLDNINVFAPLISFGLKIGFVAN